MIPGARKRLVEDVRGCFVFTSIEVSTITSWHIQRHTCVMIVYLQKRSLCT